MIILCISLSYSVDVIVFSSLSFYIVLPWFGHTRKLRRFFFTISYHTMPRSAQHRALTKSYSKSKEHQSSSGSSSSIWSVKQTSGSPFGILITLAVTNIAPQTSNVPSTGFTTSNKGERKKCPVSVRHCEETLTQNKRLLMSARLLLKIHTLPGLFVETHEVLNFKPGKKVACHETCMVPACPSSCQQKFTWHTGF